MIEVKVDKMPDGKIIATAKILSYFEEEQSSELQNNLNKCAEQGAQYAIIDFNNFMANSAALGSVISISDQFQNLEGSIGLIGVSEELLSLLELLGFTYFVPIYETKEDAIDFFD